jgi:S1-C subfamily serine protease
MEELAWQGLGLDVTDHPQAGGVVVKRIRTDGPAAAIGIRPGDVISALGGRDLAETADFHRNLAAFRNSQSVLLSVVRGRRLYRVNVPMTH